MMPGLVPVSDSYEDTPLRGGPVVRLRTSTECTTAKVQKEVGAPLATRFERWTSRGVHAFAGEQLSELSR
eukprot:2622169-Pleurochrysis_carterae.AAC.9